MTDQELKQLSDLIAERMSATAVKKKEPADVPFWVWAILGGIILGLIGYAVYSFWDVIFGTSVQAAQNAENKHNRLILIGWAALISAGIMWASFWFLAIFLDPFTVRREFMEKVKEHKASSMSMAVYSVGTAIYAGLVFSSVLNALSAGS